MKRALLFILLNFFLGSISAQKPFASYVDHDELLSEGYAYSTQKSMVFDPEGLVLKTSSSRLKKVTVDHYFKSPNLIVVLNGQVINNLYIPAGEDQVASERESCVQSPDGDISWVSGSFEDAVNAAIANERSYFDSPGENIADYVHPAYSDLYELSENVIAALRTAYAAAYEDLDEITIEIDQTLNDISLNYCCTMDICDTFNHQGPCLGMLIDRIEAGIGTNSCWLNIGENIGAAYGYSNDETALLHILYNMMYYDESCCYNTHRELILKCTFTGNSKLGFGIHFPQDDDPYDILMTWHFVTFTYNSGCTWDTPIGTPTCLLLPLEWKSLSIEKETCQDFTLQWETFHEVNVDRFVVEKAMQNQDFTKVYTVPAKNSWENNQYFYKDVHLGNSPVYFRIRSIDQNGLSSYSSVVSVQNDCQSGLTFYPNPAKDVLRLLAEDPILGIEIIDIHGVKKITTSTDPNEINIEGLEAGMYFLKVKSQRGSFIKKFIKD